MKKYFVTLALFGTACVTFAQNSNIWKAEENYEEGKYVAAICAAPTVLASLGILKGKRITCYPSVENQIQGAVLTKMPATVDGNIITGRGAGAAIDFALKLIEALAGTEKADEIAEAILYE